MTKSANAQSGAEPSGKEPDNNFSLITTIKTSEHFKLLTEEEKQQICAEIEEGNEPLAREMTAIITDALHKQRKSKLLAKKIAEKTAIRIINGNNQAN